MYLFGVVNNKLEKGYYRIKIWHEQTGNEIYYKGPYDICNNFRLFNKYKPHNTSEECPYFGPFAVSISRPLYKELPGIYEVTLQIFDNKNEELGKSINLFLACVDSPFIISKKVENFDVNNKREFTLTKETGSIQIK
jgi:hypothetical protein